jgi:hypothetical protein
MVSKPGWMAPVICMPWGRLRLMDELLKFELEVREGRSSAMAVVRPWSSAGGSHPADARSEKFEDVAQ